MSDDVLLKRRREINRKAATKSRRKQKELALNVKKTYYQEQSTNTKLIYERKQLMRERDEILSKLEEHRRVCARPDHLSASLSTVSMKGEVPYNVREEWDVLGEGFSGERIDRPSRRYSLPVPETQPAESEFDVESGDANELVSSGSLSEGIRRSESLAELDLFDDIAGDDLDDSDMLYHISPISEGTEVVPDAGTNFFRATPSVYYNDPVRQIEGLRQSDMFVEAVVSDVERHNDVITGEVYSSPITDVPAHICSDFFGDFATPAGSSYDGTITRASSENEAIQIAGTGVQPVYNTITDTGINFNMTSLPELAVNPSLEPPWTEWIEECQNETMRRESSPTRFNFGSQSSMLLADSNFTSDLDQLNNLEAQLQCNVMTSDNMTSFHTNQEDDLLN